MSSPIEGIMMTINGCHHLLHPSDRLTESYLVLAHQLIAFRYPCSFPDMRERMKPSTTRNDPASGESNSSIKRTSSLLKKFNLINWNFMIHLYGSHEGIPGLGVWLDQALTKRSRLNSARLTGTSSFSISLRAQNRTTCIRWPFLAATTVLIIDIQHSRVDRFGGTI